MKKGKHFWYCGCCGNAQVHDDDVWCVACKPHVSRDRRMSFHERTYEAIHGNECPNTNTKICTVIGCGREATCVVGCGVGHLSCEQHAKMEDYVLPL